MIDRLQNTADGLMIGSSYGLLALGFTLIFGVMRRLNLSYGPSIMIGAYLGTVLHIQQGAGPLAVAGVVIATLAVAIGMNTAIFSVFNAVVLRPLGYPEAGRLVWLSTIHDDGDGGFVTGPDFADWRAQATSFERMAAYGTVDYTMVLARGATRVQTASNSRHWSSRVKRASRARNFSRSAVWAVAWIQPTRGSKPRRSRSSRR